MQTLRGKPDRKTGRRVVIDLQKAERALKDGRHKDVEDVCTEILEERPGHVYALQVLAELRLKERRLEEAEALIEQARTGEPDNPRTMNLLGRVSEIRGLPGEAEAFFRRAVELGPDYPDAHANLGEMLRRSGRDEEAERCFRAAMKVDAEHGIANLSMGRMLYDRGRPDLAVPHLQAGLKRELSHRDGQYTLATSLLELGRTDEAITSYRRLIATGDADPNAFSNLAEALEATGDLEGAAAGFEASLELAPDHAQAAAGLARVLDATGQRPAALRLLGPRVQAGDAAPQVRIAYARLLRKAGRDEQALAHLGEVIKAPGGRRHAVAAHTMVGDILDGMGEYDRAFAHYQRANLLTGSRYAPEAREDFVSRLIEVLTPETIDALPRGSESEAPVFIVGMPRSGASLVERIIAAHPRGGGAGPLPHMGLSAGRIGRYNKAGMPYPECVTLLIRKDVQELSSGYLLRLITGHPRARRVADSMWRNFDHLGFIEILFPRARVIHCRRDPVDAGLSCYFHSFGANGSHFAQDLGAIGHYYGQYRRLADHWRARSRLSMLELDYEALVGEPEAQARRLMEFLDLPWDPACLELGDSPGGPIRTDSVGRSRHYEEHLAALVDSLAEAGYPPER